MVGLVDLKWFHIQFRGDHEVVSGILQVLVDFLFIYNRYKKGDAKKLNRVFSHPLFLKKINSK